MLRKKLRTLPHPGIAGYPKFELGKRRKTVTHAFCRRDGVNEFRPVRRNPHEGWAEDAQRLAEQGGDALVWPELANEGDEALVW